MLKYVHLIFCFAVCFISCQEDATKQVEAMNASASFTDKYSLIETGSISIPIDKETANWTRKIDIYVSEANKEYLVYENGFNQQLQFYDLETGEETQVVPLSTEGPNSVKCLSGFHVKSLDSIYVFCEYAYQVFLVNNRGEVMDSYKWLDAVQPSDAVLSKTMMYTGNMVIAKGDDLYVPTTPVADYEAYTKLYCHQYINPKKKENKYNFTYPAMYEEENFNHLSSITYRCLMPNGNFLFSFQADGNLYETDLKGSVSVHSGASKKNAAPIPIPVRHSKATTELEDEFMVKSPSYRCVFYDKSNELYYRVALGGGEANWTKWEAHKETVSIIILDKQLNRVGETVLEKNKFLYRNILMSSKGLLVSNANPDNPNVSEDELRFSIFQPKRIIN